jgi:hypothetical protein
MELKKQTQTAFQVSFFILLLVVVMELDFEDNWLRLTWKAVNTVLPPSMPKVTAAPPKRYGELFTWGCRAIIQNRG